MYAQVERVLGSETQAYNQAASLSVENPSACLVFSALKYVFV